MPDSVATATTEPWLRLSTGYSATASYVNLLTARAPSTGLQAQPALSAIFPANLNVTAFSGDINLAGLVTLMPAERGGVDLFAAGSINGFVVDGVEQGAAAVSMADSQPDKLPSITTPIAQQSVTGAALDIGLAQVTNLFASTGATNLSLNSRLTIHGQNQSQSLHSGDSNPVHIYAERGDISGLTLFSPKATRIVAGNDITDVAFYVQNVGVNDLTLVDAGRDIIPYNPNSILRQAAVLAGNSLSFVLGDVGIAGDTPNAGDIQIAGPGSLEVLAGRSLDLGSGTITRKDGLAEGITSIGAEQNPYLAKIVAQEGGANIVVAAGISKSGTTADNASSSFQPGLANVGFNYAAFISLFLDPDPATSTETRYLPVLGELMGSSSTDPYQIRSEFDHMSEMTLADKEAKDRLLLAVFSRILRDSGRDHNDGNSPYARTYEQGVAAIQTLMPGSLLPNSDGNTGSVWQGNISMPSKLVKTYEGGDISLLVPGGLVTVGRASDKNTPDQGILTQRGGQISIFSSGNVDVGTSRIFTLRGGDEVIWSTKGNIAAGSGSKTVAAAPPTRVLVDPQSADVQNDLAGLATGSGIGVLATLAGVKPGDVDLIAPTGTIDAGDAGIRSSGMINVSAVTVVNAANIQSSAGTTGTPVVVAPNISGLTTASTASAGASSSAGEAARQQQRAASQQQEDVLPSIIQVEVLGYGGGEGEDVSKKKDEAGNG